MNAMTKFSVKGQIVVPKEVRDALGWKAGTSVEVVQRPDGVLLRSVRPKPAHGGMTFDERIAKIRAIINYQGPPISKEEWKESIGEYFRTRDEI
ncbi:AbrB/MazE/SpoVT family DNA-binding domain-containing protein [Sandaracinobacteroides saxicola]|uniref:AbrB/MazE/SpoVT family DNA-binding domain-containing protein n=1 Tax=Sandaracinobacteroides saxicola TaxID=2759707 RepID=A0A7G5IEH8_9SPHN|nr:AbrB/MazE/SpoVT family DNA-binding domain-containing protein [Sandaracinobacteroides saxicola]QMW21770.1 AbrB/MazE/SpoVT family DNA-binding domain-containing protein [Sandaracinobacteroides saxicola]